MDAHIAAELVIRAKQTQATAIQTQAHYPVANQAPQQLGLQVPPQQTAATGGQPNLANLISSLDGPSLQRVLGALQNSPQTPTAFSPTQNPELAALLGGVARQPPPPQAPPAQAPPQGYVYGQPQFPFNTYPQSQQGAPQYQQQQAAAPPQPQHVQNIMQQLARWKQ